MTRLLASSVAFFILASLVTFNQAADAAPRAVQQNPPAEHPGKALLETVCASCHAPAVITEQPRTKSGWTEVFEQMIQYGASASDAQFDEIFDYLIRHHSIVNVNKAPAAELEPTLDVTEKVALAIVAYREENGPFKTIDDLKLVPGIDAAKLDARAKRLRY